MNSFICTEIHPFICVYSNVFSDIKDVYQSIKFSEENSNNRSTHLNWSKWHVFGTYSYTHLEHLNISDDEHLEKERKALLEIYEKRQQVLADYCNRYAKQLPENFYIDDILVALKYTPDLNPEVKAGQPYITKAMEYHTDFHIKDIEKPGPNFLVTCNIYFNDDYEGGEILFSIEDKLLEYKPKAGDFVVMPSGSPVFPGKEPYFHAVGVVKNGHKFFSRNFIKYINKGTEEWLANQAKYGEEKWEQMEKERDENATPVSLNCMVLGSDGTKTYNPILDKYYWK